MADSMYKEYTLSSENFFYLFCLLFQIGKTKVFLRAGQMAELDTRRSEILGKSASIIQRKVRTYLARQTFVLLRLSAKQIQAACRGLCLFIIWNINLLVGSKQKVLKFLEVLNCDCRTSCSTSLQRNAAGGFKSDDSEMFPYAFCKEVIQRIA